MAEESRIEDFWRWFRNTAGSIAADFTNAELLEELDARMQELDGKLSWEIGPGSHETYQFVISPNLEVEMRERAREIIAKAPVIEGWEFHAARPPKKWDYKLLMHRADGKPVELDASQWGFVILHYPDGANEFLLRGRDLPPLDDNERWQAAAIALESILGEEALLDLNAGFELVDRFEPRFAAMEKPIQMLRQAVLNA